MNSQTLLYMQADINELEAELRDLAHDDYDSGKPEKRAFPRQWAKLVRARGVDSLQLKKCLELRNKLDYYCRRLTHLVVPRV